MWMDDEREDVIASRISFVIRYLTEYEPRWERWLQIPAHVVDADRVLKERKRSGYEYFDSSNSAMVEFHEDSVHDSEAAKEYTRRMSVRAPPNSRPILLVGQDEALFAQYAVQLKSWSGPKGERLMDPKTEGDKLMLSSFIGREIGFGRKLSDEELTLINLRRRSQDYVNQDAAKEVLDKVRKEALKKDESPFTRYLHIGAANEGYWNSSHMAVQLEDVTDCLKVLYPNHDIVILFDHSQDTTRNARMDSMRLR